MTIFHLEKSILLDETKHTQRDTNDFMHTHILKSKLASYAMWVSFRFLEKLHSKYMADMTINCNKNPVYLPI